MASGRSARSVTTEDIPEGVALARAGWRFRRLGRIIEDIKDAQRTRDVEIAAINDRYDRYHRAKQAEYDDIRRGFIDLTEQITTGSALLPDEILLAGEWLDQIPPPDDIDHP
jgi:hypothetical protein